MNARASGINRYMCGNVMVHLVDDHGFRNCAKKASTQVNDITREETSDCCMWYSYIKHKCDWFNFVTYSSLWQRKP